MAEKKTKTLSVRITPSLQERVLKAEEVSGVPYPVLVVRAIESVCEIVEKQGFITFPLSIVAPAKKSNKS